MKQSSHFMLVLCLIQQIYFFTEAAYRNDKEEVEEVNHTNLGGRAVPYRIGNDFPFNMQNYQTKLYGGFDRLMKNIVGGSLADLENIEIGSIKALYQFMRQLDKKGIPDHLKGSLVIHAIRSKAFESISIIHHTDIELFVHIIRMILTKQYLYNGSAGEFFAILSQYSFYKTVVLPCLQNKKELLKYVQSNIEKCRKEFGEAVPIFHKKGIVEVELTAKSVENIYLDSVFREIYKDLTIKTVEDSNACKEQDHKYEAQNIEHMEKLHEHYIAALGINGKNDDLVRAAIIGDARLPLPIKIAWLSEDYDTLMLNEFRWNIDPRKVSLEFVIKIMKQCIDFIDAYPLFDEFFDSHISLLSDYQKYDLRGLRENFNIVMDALNEKKNKLLIDREVIEAALKHTSTLDNANNALKLQDKLLIIEEDLAEVFYALILLEKIRKDIENAPNIIRKKYQQIKSMGNIAPASISTNSSSNANCVDKKFHNEQWNRQYLNLLKRVFMMNPSSHQQSTIIDNGKKSTTHMNSSSSHVMEKQNFQNSVDEKFYNGLNNQNYMSFEMNSQPTQQPVAVSVDQHKNNVITAVSKMRKGIEVIDVEQEDQDQNNQNQNDDDQNENNVMNYSSDISKDPEAMTDGFFI